MNLLLMHFFFQASQDGESTLESDGGPEHTLDENTEVSADTTSLRDQAQSTASSQSVSRVTPKIRGRKRQLDDLRSAVNELKTVHNNLNNQPECQVSENEAFGQYITACLNKLPVQDSVMLQSEIQSLVTKYRLKAVQTSVAVNTPSKTPSQALDEEHPLISLPESVEEQDVTFDGSIYPQEEQYGTFHELLPPQPTSTFTSPQYPDEEHFEQQQVQFSKESSGQGKLSNILSKAWKLS